jgi:uncharacterized membrane protein YagU involved in acid resistance
MADLKIVASTRPAHALKMILWAGLVAGVLDGADAVIIIPWLKHIGAVRILQFIASGLLGVRAFRGGWWVASLGLTLHFLIAISAAAIYYAISAKLPVPSRKPFIFGPVFGLMFFGLMQYVVVPLSVAPKQPPIKEDELLNLVLSHMLFVGLPIALITRRLSNVGSRATNELNEWNPMHSN